LAQCTPFETNMKRTATAFFFIFLSLSLTAAQLNQVVLDYIDTYKAVAIREMGEYKIPASITLAQGILESGAGQSELAKKSNNHFGIKCHNDWTGEKVYYDDDAKDECFRKYDEVEDSYRDHSEFLSSKQRYAALFELDIDDYKGWAKGLKAAGYATNPKYADLLISMIEEYELYQYDKMSLADIKKTTHDKKKTEPEKNKEEPKEEEDTFTWGGYAGNVFYFNRIPTITVKAGDTPEQLAEIHHVKLHLLKDYNDIENGGELVPGTKFYLQPKRKNGETKYHTVKEGETMWTISRDEGVRLSQLYKYNRLSPGQEPATGEEINLRNKRKDMPKLSAGKKVVEKKTETKSEEIKTTTKTSKEGEIKIEEKENNDDIFIDFDDPLDVPETIPEEKIPEIITPEEQAVDPVINDQPSSEKTPIHHLVEAKETLYALSKKYGVTVQQLQEWNGLQDNNIRVGQDLIVGYK